MKARLKGLLRCPLCRGGLRLQAFLLETVCLQPRSTLEGAAEEIVKDGVLRCDLCRVWFPIANYVPVLLPFATPFHTGFAGQHADRLAAEPGYASPTGQPRPGEEAVQETFTDQWDYVQQDELSFAYTLDDLTALNRQVWLGWLEEGRRDVKSVLDVGCGLGRESEALLGVAPSADVVGIDLNFALLQSGPVYKSRSNLHLVIASLFALPFAPASFDLVYSEGVLHHTYSTRKAFNAIAEFVRPEGRLFVWVYGLDDHLVLRGHLGALSRLQRLIEALLRPSVSRAPRSVRDLFFAVATVMAHFPFKSRAIHKNKWRWHHTNHSLRDWLSHRYAHRHSFNQVLEWFEDLGFKVVGVQSPAAYRRLFGKRLWGVGVTGRKV